MNPTTAASASRATMVHTARPRISAASPRFRTSIIGSSRRRRRVRAIHCEAVAPDSSTSSQMHTSLSPARHAVHLRQQAQHHEAESEVVGLGQCVQARQRIGESQQSDGAGEKEECASDDGDRRSTDSRTRLIGRPAARGSPGARRRASPSRKRRRRTPPAARASRRRRASRPRRSPRPAAAPPRCRPCRSNCAAIMRSASAGPRRTRTRPSATIARMNAAAPSRNSVMALARRPAPWPAAAPPSASCSTTGAVIVEAVVDEHALGLAGWHGARQEAGDRREGVARKPRREGQRAGDEARAAAACAG